MIERKGLIITVLSIIIGGLLSIWLYIRFRILFFFIFIPIFTVGGSLFRNLWRSEKTVGKEIEHRNYTIEDDE